MTTNINLSGTGPGNCGIDNAVSRVSSSITEVAQKAYKVANGTIRTAVIARDGMDKANQAIVGLRKIACVMSDLEAMIEQLSLHAGKLREMPDAFEQFTQEVIWVTDKYTREDINSNNLNAMREELASIAAGTAGKISEVSQQITHLTDEVGTCINAIDAGIRQVEEGHRAAYNSFAVLDQVLDTLEENSIKIDQILAAAEEVSKSGSEMIGIVNKVVAEINSSAQYITHISGKLRNGTVSPSCSKEPHEYGDDIPLHPFISEDLLLT